MHTNTDFFVELAQTYRPIINHINKILEKHGLSSSHWRVLRIIEKSQVKTYGDISTELQIEKPALTKLIKKLLELEIVIVEHGIDKREKKILLTNYGKEKVQTLRDELKPYLECALNGISQDEIEIAKKIFRTIQQNSQNY